VASVGSMDLMSLKRLRQEVEQTGGNSRIKISHKFDTNVKPTEGNRKKSRTRGKARHEAARR